MTVNRFAKLKKLSYFIGQKKPDNTTKESTLTDFRRFK